MNRPWDELSPTERARRVREHLAAAHASCTRCGYDLFGLEGVDCPECGAPVDQNSFSFLAPAPDDHYQARRLAEYLKKYKTACPRCHGQLDTLDGCACPRCGARLDVWQLTPRGLRGGKQTRLKWALIIIGVYVLLAAMAGAIMFVSVRAAP